MCVPKLLPFCVLAAAILGLGHGELHFSLDDQRQVRSIVREESTDPQRLRDLVEQAKEHTYESKAGATLKRISKLGTKPVVYGWYGRTNTHDLMGSFLESSVVKSLSTKEFFILTGAHSFCNEQYAGANKIEGYRWGIVGELDGQLEEDDKVIQHANDMGTGKYGHGIKFHTVQANPVYEQRLGNVSLAGNVLGNVDTQVDEIMGQHPTAGILLNWCCSAGCSGSNC